MTNYDELKKAAERICDGYKDDLDAGAVLALLAEREKLLKVVEAATVTFATTIHDALKELEK